MMKIKENLLFMGCLLFAFSTLLSQDEIVGVWDKSDGKGKMEIYKSSDGKYFGRILTVSERFYKNGQPPVDHLNPSTKLQTRPVIGITCLTNVCYTQSNQWTKGTIYDPEKGKYFPCEFWLADNGKTLKMKGYWGVLYETHQWGRVN